MAWAWWLGAALLLALAEMLSLDLFLLMLAGGALVATLLALLGVPLWGQILGFALASGLMLGLVRPWLLRHLRTRVPLRETNAAGLPGKVAVVVATVTEFGGRVKLTGEVWTARTEAGEVLEVGAHARVVRIAGATAVVTAAPSGSTPDSEPPGTGTSPSPADLPGGTTS